MRLKKPKSDRRRGADIIIENRESVCPKEPRRSDMSPHSGFKRTDYGSFIIIISSLQDSHAFDLIQKVFFGFDSVEFLSLLKINQRKPK